MIELAIVGTTRAALIDDDFANFVGLRWRLHPQGYVYRYSETRIKLAHAVAGAPPPGFWVVHGNGDRMDYRRVNMVTESEEKCRRRIRLRQTGNHAAQGDLFADNIYI